MVTKRQTQTIIDSVVKELVERSMGDDEEAYIDIQPKEVGEIVKVLLLPITGKEVP